MKHQSKASETAIVSVSKSTKSLISRLEDACQRPLFSEIVLVENIRAQEKQVILKEARLKKTVETALTVSTEALSLESPGNRTLVRPESKSLGVSITTGSSMAVDTDTALPTARKRSRIEDREDPCTWEELLAEAASQDVHNFTEREHGEVLRLASILLLGYIYPYSTGNDYHMLKNANRRQFQHTKSNEIGNNNKSKFDPVYYVLHMPLAERLEKSLRAPLSAKDHQGDSGNEHGAVLTNDSWELAFDSFLSNGLIPLLQCRPYHREQVDLLHLIAMIIHPKPDNCRINLKHLKSKHSKNIHWIKAQELMNHIAAFQFQIHYQIRLRFIKLVADQLNLTMEGGLHERSERVVGPLLHGALPHLRASLYAFSETSARTVVHAHFCHAALSSIACQTRNERILDETWDYLLHKLVDDPTTYGCKDCHCEAIRSKRQLSLLPLEDLQFCPHQARGWLLSEFIVRSCRSKYNKNLPFYEKMATSLTDAIEWQVDCWTKHEDGEPERDVSKLHATCMLASLLSSAKSLIFFFPIINPSQIEEDEEIEVETHEVMETLVESSIRLLWHHDIGIARAAAGLSVSTLEVGPIDKFAPLLFNTLKLVIAESGDLVLLEKVIAVASHRSPAFGSNFFQFLLSHVSTLDKSNPLIIELIYRWIAVVCSNSPSVASRDMKKLRVLLSKTENFDLSRHIVAAILSARRSKFFRETGGGEDDVVNLVLKQETNEWRKYQMACHALLSGNFYLASKMYLYLMKLPLSESHFLWMSALQQIASAEASLAQDAAIGIPDAAVKLHSALWHLTSIENNRGYMHTTAFTFQIRFIKLRINFLDLVMTLRQLTREMRLTGMEPAKYTRPYIHLQNVVKGFECLTSCYGELLQQWGLIFHSERSIGRLRLIQFASKFMAVATCKIFSNVLQLPAEKIATEKWNVGNFKEPMATLIQQLDDLVISSMDGSVSHLIRAAAGLEIIDSILMVPLPFPRDIFIPVPNLTAILEVFPDPDLVSEIEEMGVIEGFPSVCFTVNCFGKISLSTRLQSRIPFWTVLLWYRIQYIAPLEEEDATGHTEGVVESVAHEAVVKRLVDVSKFSPITSDLFQDGSFLTSIECPQILDEGHFMLEMRLGCRDAAGNNWEVSLPNETHRVPIRISRFR